MKRNVSLTLFVILKMLQHSEKEQKQNKKTLNDFDSSFHFRYFNNAISLTKLSEPINYAFRKWQLKDLTKICCLLKAEPLNTQKIEAGLFFSLAESLQGDPHHSLPTLVVARVIKTLGRA